jgi:hypothetical protein
MKHLGVEVLSDCQSDCLKIFNQARELRGKSKQAIYDSATFKELKARILAQVEEASDRDILAFILRKAACFLKKS